MEAHRKGAQEDFMNKYHQRHIDMNYMIAQSQDDVRNKINKLCIDNGAFIDDRELIAFQYPEKVFYSS